MLVQEMVINRDHGPPERPETVPQYTPLQKLSRSDVSFPLSTPKRRAPSITSFADLADQEVQSLGRLTIRAEQALQQEYPEHTPAAGSPTPYAPAATMHNLHDLPLEVQGKILDFIFGDMHSVNANSTSLRGKNVSSLMRHPRRKAVSDLALVSQSWRDLVQERIYRHIKLKGTRSGIQQSEEYFCTHSHLTKHVRHIEFWVPVWGDKAPLVNDESFATLRAGGPRHLHYPLATQGDDGLIQTANHLLGFSFKLCPQTATLSEIFSHISIFFPAASIFSLEGGHCKKSQMIRHFPQVLFSSPDRRLAPLPQIRTFAMRGAWNVMRQYSDWENIELALPNVTEWHCNYAKPRLEAETTINSILAHFSTKLRHVTISLDGMYSKDHTTLSSSHSSSSSLAHLCDNLGVVLPQLESLSFTGKVCECMWASALSVLTGTFGFPSEYLSYTTTTAPSRQEPRLTVLELIVKSCCRQRVLTEDPTTGGTMVEELGGVMADGVGITNLVFIKAFERLVLHTVNALQWFPKLDHVRIRYIDLDSPCTLLNPFWHLDKHRVWGIWSEEILERLQAVRPDATYVELSDGIDTSMKKRRASSEGDVVFGSMGGDVAVGPGGGAGALYPRAKPRSIKTSSYRVLAEARGQ